MEATASSTRRLLGLHDLAVVLEQQIRIRVAKTQGKNGSVVLVGHKTVRFCWSKVQGALSRFECKAVE